MRSEVMLSAAVAILSIVALCTGYAAWREDRQGKLTVSFLNIGQGDAIFIEAPSGRQVLIDGGPDGAVQRQLGIVMPWYDRSIDVVIPTHPDSDHIGGLIDVLKHYDVGTVLQSSVSGTTDIWNILEDAIRADAEKGTRSLIAQRGQIIDLGAGAYLEVLAPDRSLPGAETNTACVVTRLVYGKTAFMLSCDAPQAIEKYLVDLDGKELKSDVLKAGHHGSRTSSSPLFVGFVDPRFAVYSRGCGNSYGHPHAETVATFARFGIPVSDTCIEGTISFVSDGVTVSRR